MKFRASPNIAVRTSRSEAAVEFYSDLLNLPDRSESSDLADFEAGPFNLFVIEDAEISGPVMELFVDDLERARKKLVRMGCEVVRWRGKGQDCYVRDPFGVLFNIWETPGA
jgi:catechol 2,3-dioxygenase-like lactoylglutathione lyase family enzyme